VAVADTGKNAPAYYNEAQAASNNILAIDTCEITYSVAPCKYFQPSLIFASETGIGFSGIA
jgi:hypothetical protein